MRIKHTNYETGVHEIDLMSTSEELGLSEKFQGNLCVDVKMDKSIHQIVLHCSIAVDALLECDRCTKQFVYEIDKDFSLVYLFNKDDVHEEDTDVHYLSAEKEYIDLTEDVVDFTELSLPLKKLCSENCKGLCPRCGEDLNNSVCKCETEEVNPVWEPLLKLKDKLNNKD